MVFGKTLGSLNSLLLLWSSSVIFCLDNLFTHSAFVSLWLALIYTTETDTQQLSDLNFERKAIIMSKKEKKKEKKRVRLNVHNNSTSGGVTPF